MDKDDSIGLVLYTRMNLRGAGLASGLLRLLLEHGGQFAPHSMEIDGKWKRFDYGSLEEVVAYWARSYNVLLQRQFDYESQLAISMGGMASGGFNTLSLWVDNAFFASNERVTNYLECCILLYDLLNPVYGRIHPSGDAIEMATIDHLIYGPTVMPVDLRKGLPDVYWGNLFGPPFVEAIGREKLERAPCHEQRVLGNGGQLLLVTDSPRRIDRIAQEELKRFLGVEHFDDRRL